MLKTRRQSSWLLTDNCEFSKPVDFAAGIRKRDSEPAGKTPPAQVSPREGASQAHSILSANWLTSLDCMSLAYFNPSRNGLSVLCLMCMTLFWFCWTAQVRQRGGTFPGLGRRAPLKNRGGVPKWHCRIGSRDCSTAVAWLSEPSKTRQPRITRIDTDYREEMHADHVRTRVSLPTNCHMPFAIYRLLLIREIRVIRGSRLPARAFPIPAWALVPDTKESGKSTMRGRSGWRRTSR